MFPNWKAEMARYGVTCKDIGGLINRNSEWVENRLQGKASLPINLAIVIRNHFFKDLSYDYLFSDLPIVKIDQKENLNANNSTN